MKLYSHTIILKSQHIENITVFQHLFADEQSECFSSLVNLLLVLGYTHFYVCFLIGPSKFRVTLTQNSTPGLHHLRVILFSSMVSWITFARLSWSPFLDSVVVSQLPAGCRTNSLSFHAQMCPAQRDRSVWSLPWAAKCQLLLPAMSIDFWRIFFPNFEPGYIFLKLLFSLTFCALNRVKCFYFSSLSWLNSSTLLLLVWFR